MTEPLMQTYARFDLEFVRGSGSWLYTKDGERYLDFGCGIAVTSLGHAHPRLVDAITQQAGELWHTSNLYRIPNQERLARRLVDATFASNVFFANSGAEAIECALKTARRYQYTRGHPERYRTITFGGAFHGRTLTTIAAGGAAKHLEGFGPPADGFDQVPLHDSNALREAIGPETAAILLEPVQGEGGITPVDHTFLEMVRRAADEFGLLVIYDEVQCGMGRTGRLFAHEWSGIAPDIMAVAKALGGGFPIGACLATGEAGEALVPGSHGSTFGGNPLATAVANAVLDVMLEEGFFETVRTKADRLRRGVEEIIARHPAVLDHVRGVGFMQGIRSHVPAADVVGAMTRRHVLTVPAGDNMVRLLPPLVVTDEEVDVALEALDGAAGELAP
ncbi:MAG: aspartate aminotransferase family protein [bacterium]|nr:aspartate aminotransferase family protein [bacterium]MDE0417772.1 aspartate aminotransferase family protein [bacterium]